MLIWALLVIGTAMGAILGVIRARRLRLKGRQFHSMIYRHLCFGGILGAVIAFVAIADILPWTVMMILALAAVLTPT